MKRPLTDILDNWMIFATAAVIILMMFGLVSCKTIQAVPEIHKEYIHDTISRVDSVYRSHYIFTKGDTIWQKDTILEYRWRDKIVEVLKTDSVPYPVEVVKEVKSVPPFYRNCTILFWLIVVAVVIYVGIRIVKLIYLRR